MSLYHSFFKKGSIAFLRLPFLDFVSRLFLPCTRKKEKKPREKHVAENHSIAEEKRV